MLDFVPEGPITSVAIRPCKDGTLAVIIENTVYSWNQPQAILKHMHDLQARTCARIRQELTALAAEKTSRKTFKPSLDDLDLDDLEL